MSGAKLIISQGEVHAAAKDAVQRLFATHHELWTATPRRLLLYGVPRGGVPAAYAVSHVLSSEYRLPVGYTDDPDLADVIVDDLVDSGTTRDRYRARYPGTPFCALYDKQVDPGVRGRWVVFPWERTTEHDDSATDIVVRLLQVIGEDPTREGLRDTPARVIKAWEEWATGYKTDVAGLFVTFEDGAPPDTSSMVLVSGIPVISKCEHHMADIMGVAHVAYIPNGRIVGLSKLARVVDAYARRLQVQERLTDQIADAVGYHLHAKGVGVLVRASHACMSTRGVKVHGSLTTTSALRGVIKEDAAARAEFLHLCREGEVTRG